MIAERVDPRVATREALRALVQGSAEWPVASPVVLRNLLMDACGGDVKPWANLLLSAREHGFVERIESVRDRGLDAWERLRTQLVVGWVAEGFLQREAAQWAVETWAFAHGIIDASHLTVPAPRVAPPPSAPVAGAARAPGSSTPPRPAQRVVGRPVPPPSMQAPPRRGGGRPVPPPTAAYQRPTLLGGGPPTSAKWVLGAAAGIPVLAALVVILSGGGRANGRSAATPPPRGAAPTVASAALEGGVRDTTLSVDDAMAAARSSAPPAAPATPAAPPPPAPEPPSGAAAAGSPRPAERPFVAAPGALAFEPPERGDVAPARRAPPASEGVPPSATGATGVGVTSITRNALPATARDSARILYVRPPARAGGLPNGLPRGAIPMTGAIAAVPTLDALHLRSGRVLRGRVEIIRASTVLFRDAEDGLRYEFPKADVESIHTEIGTVVRFDRAGAPLSARRGSLVARGVGGAYTVAYRVRSVRGSESCRSLWQRPLTADRVTVRHEPGADTLLIAFEGGDQFPSVIDQDAWFASTFRIMPDQARQSTALTTRLNGRFTDAGFEGEVNVIAYRRARAGDDTACHSILDMRASRADATTGARSTPDARRAPRR